jgi:hypothetical protein
MSGRRNMARPFHPNADFVLCRPLMVKFTERNQTSNPNGS